MKKILLSLIVTTLLLPIIPATAQTTKKKQSPITIVMAKKIGVYCQYNKTALRIFSAANPEQVQNRMDKADILLRELDKHLDCAENFIITLYYNLGIEISYFALKDAGFTIKEIDTAEAIWKKEQEKIDIEIARQKEKEKIEMELAIKERINDNDIFSDEELAREAIINWDGLKTIYDRRVFGYIRTNGNRKEYSVCIDKDSTIVANNINNSFISDNVLNILKHNRHIPSKILFKNDSVAVKSYVSLITESIVKGYRLNVKKSKKGWELKTDIESSHKGVKVIVSELMNLLNNSDLSQLDNKKYHLEAYIATYCLNQKVCVQEMIMNIYVGYSNNAYSSSNNDSALPIYSKHYPFTEYNTLYEL